VKEEAVGLLFRIEVRQEPAEVPGVGAAPRVLGRMAPRPLPLTYSAPAVDGEAGRGETPVLVQDAPMALRGDGGRPNGGARGAGARGSGGARPAAARPATSSDSPARSAVSPGSPGAQAAAKRPAVGQAVGSAPARNQPCPCGSGKKYKHCHGAPNAV
jgi:preprotein translocase subunit SecA